MLESGKAVKERLTTSAVQRMFGSRKLKDWKLLESVSTGATIVEEADSPIVNEDFTTVKRNRHGKLLARPTQRLHAVGMDIGHGPETSPGGHRHALTLVDFCTRHTWVYGMPNKSGSAVIDALCISCCTV